MTDSNIVNQNQKHVMRKEKTSSTDGNGPNVESKIETYIGKKRKDGEKVLIPFIMAGDPNIEISEKLAVELLENGGDILELGLPYSDPLADGPVIQEASQRAKNTRIKDVLALVKRLRQKTEKPLVLLAYYNPIYQYGSADFIEAFSKAGLDGLVIPDLDWEERKKLENEAAGKLDLIHFITPTSEEEKIKETAKKARGFIYCVSIAGVTGTRIKFSNQVMEAVNIVRKYTHVPLAIGFGISNPSQAREAAKITDGAIVGSALIKELARIVDQYPEDEVHAGRIDLAPLTNTLRQMKDAMHNCYDV